VSGVGDDNICMSPRSGTMSLKAIEQDQNSKSANHGPDAKEVSLTACYKDAFLERSGFGTL